MNFPFFHKLNELTVLHNQAAVTKFCQFGIMGHYNERLPQRVTKTEEQFVYILLCGRIQIAGWFVGKKHSRTVYQGSGNSHTLLLTSRHFGWLVRATLFQSHKFQKPFRICF